MLKTAVIEPPRTLPKQDTYWNKLVESTLFAPVLLLVLFASEAVVLLAQASRKLFWYDELFTLNVSSLHPFSRLIEALRAGADGMPPTYYLLARLGTVFPGDIHTTLRLMPLLGYFLTLLGIYWFVTRRLPRVAGLVAVTIVILSPFRPYAIEARPYSLLVGFLAIAAACWQRIGEKRFMTALFALFLTLAASCHYINVVSITVFAVAELAWSMGSRQVRWRVWAAFGLAAIPFLSCTSLASHIRSMYGKYFWAMPSFGNAITSYEDYLGRKFKFAFVLVVGVGLLFIGAAARAWRQFRAGVSRPDPYLPDLALACSFLFYPAVLSILTKLVGSGYAPRYAWQGILGLVLVPILLTRKLWYKPYAIYVLAALLIGVALNDTHKLEARVGSGSELWALGDLPALCRRVPDVPVVIAGPLGFLEDSHYAPPELRDRLVEVVNLDNAAHLSGSDTCEKANTVMATVVPLHIEQLADFQSEHSKFLLQSGGDWDWLTAYLLRQGYHMTLMGIHSEVALYLVEH